MSKIDTSPKSDTYTEAELSLGLDAYPRDNDYLNVENRDTTHEESSKARTNLTASEVARSAGDGSNSWGDVQKDDANIIVNDGRSITRTTFWPSDLSQSFKHKQSYMNKLAILNDGSRAPDRSTQNSIADRNRIVDTFCGRCEVSHEDRIIYLYKQFDMNRKGPYAKEHIILAIMSLVCQSHGRYIQNESEFIDLLEETDFTQSKLRTCKDLCREHFDRENVEISPE